MPWFGYCHLLIWKPSALLSTQPCENLHKYFQSIWCHTVGQSKDWFAPTRFEHWIKHVAVSLIYIFLNGTRNYLLKGKPPDPTRNYFEVINGASCGLNCLSFTDIWISYRAHLAMPDFSSLEGLWSEGILERGIKWWDSHWKGRMVEDFMGAVATTKRNFLSREGCESWCFLWTKNVVKRA